MPRLLDRLTQQLASKGLDNPAGMAEAILKKRGHLDADGNLTYSGHKRQSLGNSGRAIDRASKRSGKIPAKYNYDPYTNRATLKK